MSALSDKGITLEGLAAAVDVLRQELATWKALARKQDTLTAAQITATQSGATAAKISQIAVNTAAIQSLAAQVAGQISLAYVTTLPATGEPFTLYLVPQGDGTAPNYCNEYLWINGAWELIGTTGAMANNGELTIQVNGVAVGTFTANQAANSAINVTVPTNTNQLVNGAQYVDASALATALALKQNNLNASQLAAVNSGITDTDVAQIATNTTAIAGKQDALTEAQQAAVDSGATVAKIDQIASNSSAIVSLTSSKQDSLSTTQLAAVNSGVTAAAVQQIGTNASNISALQTAVAGKAADADVVHLAGAETITGDKTFTGAVVTHNITPETDNTYSLGTTSKRWTDLYASKNISIYEHGLTFGVTPATSAYFGFRYYDNTGNVYGDMLFNSNSNGSNFLRLRCRNTNGTDTYDRQVQITVKQDGTTHFLPNNSGVTELGTSSNKWKTLNGINPGALSLPAVATTWLDTTGWVLDGTTENSLPIPGSTTTLGYGWLQFRVSHTLGVSSFVKVDVSYRVWTAQDENCLPIYTLWMPVFAGASFRVIIKADSVQVRFHPSLGNV